MGSGDPISRDDGFVSRASYLPYQRAYSRMSLARRTRAFARRSSCIFFDHAGMSSTRIGGIILSFCLLTRTLRREQRARCRSTLSSLVPPSIYSASPALNAAAVVNSYLIESLIKTLRVRGSLEINLLARSYRGITAGYPRDNIAAIFHRFCLPPSLSLSLSSFLRQSKETARVATRSRMSARRARRFDRPH